MNLKNLYKYLAVDNQYKWNGWHKEYKIICAAIAKIRDLLNKGKNIDDKAIYDCDEIKALKGIGRKTEVCNYNTLLQVLLYDKDNGIASRGQSVLSREKLQELQQDMKFKNLICEAIKSPDNVVCEKIKEEWLGVVEKNNPLLVYRFIAACTTEVSSLVNESQFDLVCDWLNENICNISFDSGVSSWYDRNKELMDIFDRELESAYSSSQQYDVYWRNMFPWIIFDNMANKFQMKRNIVKYGPPGTGKTFQAKAISNIQFNIWKDLYAENFNFKFDDHIETVQFHQSYTYEDFIEGLRPKLDNTGKAQLSLQNGIFKDFCKKAGRWELMLHKIDPDRKINGSEKEKSWVNTTILDLEDFLSTKQEVYKELTENADWSFILKYYNKNKKILDMIPPYFFVIDEINRADLSRVFGELMYCLEYRGIDGNIKTQYSNLNTDKEALLTKTKDTNHQEKEYRFFIPRNVYIIGTMNTIDRSVESFDFALRRRFSWEEVLPNTELLRDHLKNQYPEWEDLANRFQKLNEAICNEKQLLGPDYQIGHAYFWNLPDNSIRKLTANQIATILWQDRIMPLLQEYLRGTGREEDLLKQFEKNMIH